MLPWSPALSLLEMSCPTSLPTIFEETAMKQCANCLEQNTDGATNCVICGEGLPVAQVGEEAPQAVVEEVLSLTEKVEEEKVEEVPKALPADPVVELVEKAQENIGVVVASPPEYIGEFPVKTAVEVYHDSEAKLVHTHVIVNDITLIGREDPQRDVFPDVDLAKLEGVSASNASREHLRILRQGNKFFLYIYRGSTGTQVNKEIIDESRYGKKFEIQIGDRIILGGKVRLKLIKQ
jgi:hypothetical protein